MDVSTLERLQSWSEAGLVSNEQAEAIRRFEAEHDVPDAPPAQFSLMTEAAAYLGTVLAFMGGVVVVGSRWEDAGVVARCLMALAIAVVGFGAGWWLRRVGEAGTDRLGSLMWVLGTGGLALGAGVLLDDADADPSWAAITIGALVAAVGMILWRNLDRPLQLITTVVGLGVVAGGLADLTGGDIWPIGAAAWVSGVALFVGAAVGRCRPRLTALAAGGVAAMLSSVMLDDLDRHVATWVAVLTAAAIVVFALRDRSTTILVVGAIGFLIATQRLLAVMFPGVLSSAVVTVVGLVVVVVAVARTRTVRPPA